MSQPHRSDFAPRPNAHDFSPRRPLPSVRASPQLARIDSPIKSTAATIPSLTGVAGADQHMSTTHRGLPPPSAMALPDPGRPSSSTFGQPLGPMPAPPNQWQGQEESMRNWLTAKAEEDRRKQEEERTRQEGYRLEQRKIEQAILRESLQAGVPPTMIPFIYAGIGGPNMANSSLEWLHQYAAHLQNAQQQQLQQLQQQPQQQHSPPDARRDIRGVGPTVAVVYGLAHNPYLPPQSLDQPPNPGGPLQTTFPAFPPANDGRPPTSNPRPSTATQLPRLTTNEMFVHQGPQHGLGGVGGPLQHTFQHEQQSNSSPSIYFHHWVPPGESKHPQQQTPARSEPPSSSQAAPQASDSDAKDSPKKRKAQGGHQPNPPPQASPSFSPASSTTSARVKGHLRNQSAASYGRDSDILSRPGSRREMDVPRSSQSLPDSGRLSDGQSKGSDSGERSGDFKEAQREDQGDS